MLFASTAAPSSAWPSVATEQSTRGARVNIIDWDMAPTKTSGDKFLINQNQVVSFCCERVIAHDVIKYHAPKPRQAEPSLMHIWCSSISSVENNLCLC